jgi:hypothetical protein
MTNDSINTAEIKDKTWLVKLKESVILEPRTQQITTGIIEGEQGQKTPPLFCIEPAKIPTEGVMSARSVSQVTSAPGKKCKFGKNPKDYTCIMLTNFSDERLTIPKSTVVGLAEEIDKKR